MATATEIKLDPDATYNKLAVAGAFQVTERAVEKWMKKRGGFPKPFYVGRTPYWRGRTLLNWMENRQQEVA
jgi:hypothetical protein